MGLDVLAMGRIGVDIYPNDVGADLDEVTSFGKYLGGSPANVAVAAARHGRSVALVTRTGNDPFGAFLHRELLRFGVDDRYVGTDPELQTQVTFCAIKPPDDFPLYFYGRFPTAADLRIQPADLDLDAIGTARIFWSTVTGLSREPSRAAHFAAYGTRKRGVAEQFTVLDLDYRPMFWTSAAEAGERAREALGYADVAIGNVAECTVAVGAGTPDEQADRLLDSGVDLAVVKCGAAGVLAKTRTERVEVAAVVVETLNGLGAGDGFGGAFCHGLLAGWPLRQTLAFANAAGAIVATRLSCSAAMPTTDEVLTLLAEREEQ